MRPDWEQWEPRGRRQQTGGTVPPDFGSGLPPMTGQSMQNPSLAGYGVGVPNQLTAYGMQNYDDPSMPPGNGAFRHSPGLSQQYGNPSVGVQFLNPALSANQGALYNATGGIVPPGYGMSAQGQPSSGYYDNPSVGQNPQLPQQNQWANMGRQPSVQPQPMLSNWWAGGR